MVTPFFSGGVTWTEIKQLTGVGFDGSVPMGRGCQAAGMLWGVSGKK